MAAGARRRWVVVSLLTACCLVTAVGAALARAPTYTATSRLVVGAGVAVPARSGSGSLEDAARLAADYSRAVTGAEVVGAVSRDLALSAEDVRSRVSGSPVTESPVFSIHATGPTERAAVTLADRTAFHLVRWIEETAGSDRRRAAVQAQMAEAARAASGLETAGQEAADAGRLPRAGRADRLAAAARLDALGAVYSDTVTSDALAAAVEVLNRPTEARDNRAATLRSMTLLALVVGVGLGTASTALGLRVRRPGAAVPDRHAATTGARTAAEDVWNPTGDLPSAGETWQPEGRDAGAAGGPSTARRRARAAAGSMVVMALGITAAAVFLRADPANEAERLAGSASQDGSVDRSAVAAGSPDDVAATSREAAAPGQRAAIPLRRFPSTSCRFSIPRTWRVVWSDLNRGQFLYSDARPPTSGALVRVFCEAPASRAGDAPVAELLATARRLAASVPGYSLVRLEPLDDDSGAVLWEHEVGGEPRRRVRMTLFPDGARVGATAPALEFARWEATFAAVLRATPRAPSR